MDVTFLIFFLQATVIDALNELLSELESRYMYVVVNHHVRDPCKLIVS